MDEGRVGQALKALRDADSGVDAGADAEVRAVLAFRRQQQRRRGFRRMAIPLAVAAAAVITIAFWQIPRATSRHTVSVQDSDSTKEVLTPFYALMPSSPRLENGVIIRVTVPASVMQRVGLPIVARRLSDPVEAEVLVGQDDLARAIRFVTYAQR